MTQRICACTTHCACPSCYLTLTKPGAWPSGRSIPVADGFLPETDRIADYRANRLGPATSSRKVAQSTAEYIMLRVLRNGATGKFAIEGMIKGAGEDLSAHVIAKNTYVGLCLVGREG